MQTIIKVNGQEILTLKGKHSKYKAYFLACKELHRRSQDFKLSKIVRELSEFDFQLLLVTSDTQFEIEHIKERCTQTIEMF